MNGLLTGRWIAVRDGDDRARALYLRHYSATKAMRTRRQWARQPAKFTGPGEIMVLLTADSRALLAWRKERYRLDDQRGVNCAVFRNESAALSSDLIREAMTLAWARWSGERLFTFVDGVRTAGRRSKRHGPGHCFVMAGWRRCGVSKDGKTILEALP